MVKKIKKSISKKRKIIVLFSIGVVVVLFGVLSWQYFYPVYNTAVRKDRIVAIYNSLKLDDTYQLTSQSVFGDKRVYEWDSGRSFSSSMQYAHGKNVDVTVAELTKAITNAGFVYFEEPYPGSMYVQLHFKSAKGEYIRMTVSSKVRDDALRNAYLMGVTPTPAEYNLDKNIGPSNVTLKVNLDDNNE